MYSSEFAMHQYDADVLHAERELEVLRSVEDAMEGEPGATAAPGRAHHAGRRHRAGRPGTAHARLALR
ncbi:hypothetical protein GE115_08295 [Agromyces sp. CFH 90414]|uniref:Uncharacterized protein n=1 Tax=Agromyces agglutinans TaxID=2662258 RepID=A0A6I2F7W0_9MICO|nr:hypothetical protein [Agromyces agglutinans]MRG59867.1 hypothetical protein [Agromyces agglutinans]